VGLLSTVHPRATGAGDDAAVKSEPYAGWIPGAAPDERTVFVVIDGRTGEPLEGVRVRRSLEPELAADGTWAPTRAEAKTDRFGLVSFNLADSGGSTSTHWTFDRAGYAPNERSGAALQDTMVLFPGADLHGRVLAPMGGPAGGVVVEWLRGCEHAPALRRAVTDADGRFVVSGATPDGELWFSGPGFGISDNRSASLLCPRAVATGGTQLTAAPTLVGRIVADDVKAFAGASVVVGGGRGPRAVVAADGSFRVDGGGSYAPLRLVRGLDETIATLAVGSVRPGGPFVWDLRPMPDGVALVEIVVRVACRGDVRPPIDIERIDVHLDNEVDGRRVTATARPDGERLVARLRVRPGRYVVSAASSEWQNRNWVEEDGPFGRWAAAGRAAEFAKATPNENEIELTLDERPAVRVIAAEGSPPLEREDSFALETPVGSPRTLIDLETPNLHVPADLDAVVWTRRGPFPLGPVRNGNRTATVDTRPDAVLRLIGVTAPDDIRIDDEAASQTFRETFIDIDFFGTPGSHRITATTTATGARAWADVEVPEGRGAVVEVAPTAWKQPVGGDVILAPLPGPKPPRVDVFVLLGEKENIADSLPGGVHRSPAFIEGAWIRLEADGYAPRRIQLTGAGPWHVAFGPATLVVAIHGDAATDILDALVDGWTPSRACWKLPASAGNPRDAILTVHGLAAGEHTVLVGGENFGAVVLRARLPEASAQPIIVELPPR
jgi:hypothetical protein